MVGNASACNPGNHGLHVTQKAQSLGQELPENLTCNICGELFQAAVTIINCKHSFCSFCIRLNFAEQSKKLKRRVSCPCCREDLFERSYSQADKVLRVNLVLQQQVFSCRQSQKQQQQQQQQEEDTSPRRRSSRRSSPPKQQQESLVIHKRNPRLQKLNKVHYNGKKRNALAALLKTFGLPTTGTEDELKNRHMRFVLYWNSLCDEHVDPPTRLTVIQQFRSSELNKQAAKRSSNIAKSSLSNYETKAESSTDKVDARAALLKEHAKGFRELYEKILENFAQKWCDTNLSLSIAVLQSHSMIQNVNFRGCLRQRAVNDDYKIKVKKLLSGEVPLPERIENQFLSGGTVGNVGASLQPSSPCTQNHIQSNSQINIQQQPPPASETFEEMLHRRLRENHDRKLQESHESKARKKMKYSSTFVSTASVEKPPASSPHGSSRNSHIPPAASDSALKISNPYSRGLGLNLPAFSSVKSTTQVTSTATKKQPLMTSASARPQQRNPYSKNTSTQPYNTMSAPFNQPNSTYRNTSRSTGANTHSAPTVFASSAKPVGQIYSYAGSSSGATTSPSMKTTSATPASIETQPRNTVSPQIVATKPVPTLFQRRKKPSWHWTCKVCAYEMKMDPKATRCTFCGSLKGATFDDVHNENKTDNPTLPSNGSCDNPIKMS